MKKKPIRLLIATSQRLFREGLASMFDKLDDFIVVGSAANGAEAIEQVTELRPDVVILDIGLPILDGVSVAHRIHGMENPTQMMIVASSYSEQHVRSAFEAGARAFLLKDCSFEELSLATRKAAVGDYYLSGPAGQDVVAEYVAPHLNHAHVGGIMTQRERELARLLADGYSSKEVADVLNISVKTVEAHRSSIMKKLNARNVTDIVRYCIRNHLIEP
jgi:DNA-binding NarL/FixJ family response regulator